MITIISCTNRKGALSYKVSLIYKKILESITKDVVEIVDLEKLPHDFTFTALYENSGKNLTFNRFRDHISSSKKFVFVIPEYNGSFPGVLKTFIDGMAYPSAFKSKTAALVGISSGKQGATLALSHMTDILNYLGCNVLAVKPKCLEIETKFIDGIIEDKMFNKLLNEQAQELATLPI